MDLPTMRARLRKDLHDEDSASYRWTDGELDRHIQHAVREFSLALPLEAKAALTTTPGSRDLSISDWPTSSPSRPWSTPPANIRRNTPASPSG